ncbi:hypothetical protein FOQG_13655 [Fusarium oxysporum f. sp. raphani 54005]|uniref:Uncharacterized protein n=2 Tax=Fusarium oxysporum TaxID=5507 RepID=X0BU37_FUSOX|nr:hypothetical protein FOQG_13655 [Fusarium oxysporum f. sp. raphani 54005]EXL69697.1 hypothetical protein FOPG_14369 [Fusarium oxysporum f. sp. conglutinans race 2 54008]
MMNLQNSKKSHSTHITAPATTTSSVTVPDTEHQGNVAPAQTHGHCAQTVATHDISTARAGSAMRRGGQAIVRDVRKQRRSTTYFDQRS